MFKAILFDLDDTLLSCSMDVFFPAYIGYLTRYVAHMIPPEVFVPELTRATRAMDANDGAGATNEATFAAAFYPAVGYEPDELVPLFERFYDNRLAPETTRELYSFADDIDAAFDTLSRALNVS